MISAICALNLKSIMHFISQNLNYVRPHWALFLLLRRRQPNDVLVACRHYHLMNTEALPKKNK